MPTLCHGCLCQITAGSLPLCETCYQELLAFPPPLRMQRATEIMQAIKAGNLAASVECLTRELAELIEQSKRYSPYRLN